MMARDYGRVRVSFWESETIRPLPTEPKFLGLYLLTSPHTNAIGCFRLPIAYVAHDTGMSAKVLENAFVQLRGAGFMEWCERHPWIWLPNYLRHNPPENANVWRRCAKELELVPSGRAQAAIADELATIATEPRMQGQGKGRVSPEEIALVKRFGNGFDTVTNGNPPCPLPNPLPLPTKKDVSVLQTDPPALDGPNPTKKAVRTAYGRDFEEFWKAYPTDQNMAKKTAFAQWQRLSPEDRSAAIAAVPAFKAFCSKDKTYRVVHACRFLSERRFEGFQPETVDPEAAAAARDRVDKLLGRGKYAEAAE